MAELDTADRRVKAIVYTALVRAHLGYMPVNREWEHVCEVCWGDGCKACNGTGETT